jgi:putative tricarboxylic transport membrane protein
MHMQVPPTYAKVGPQIFPYIIALGLGLTGLVIAWRGWHGETPGDEGGTAPTDWRSVAVIAAGLIAHLNLLKPLGFVPAGLILFMSVTFAFGSRRYLRDAIVGVALTAAAYIGFSYGLGLQLPPGILKGLL